MDFALIGFDMRKRSLLGARVRLYHIFLGCLRTAAAPSASTQGAVFFKHPSALELGRAFFFACRKGFSAEAKWPGFILSVWPQLLTLLAIAAHSALQLIAQKMQLMTLALSVGRNWQWHRKAAKFYPLIPMINDVGITCEPVRGGLFTRFI